MTRGYPGLIFSLLLVVALLLGACGGAGDAAGTTGEETAAAEANAREVPTMPVARFAQPTTMISPDRAETPAPAEDSGAEEVDLDRGATIYANRCASCHGAEGEGTDDGGSIAGLALTQNEFATLLRTGNQGALGTEHIFGPAAISPTGLDALYAFVLSLSE